MFLTIRFNKHPPLGVNATCEFEAEIVLPLLLGFNKHPPLGVNATERQLELIRRLESVGFNKHPPLGVNATWSWELFVICSLVNVSTSTHPWG